MVSGLSTPHSLVPTSTKLLNGRFDSMSGYAKAAALQGGKHLKGLGEAGYKFVSSQYGQWRSGSWEGATARCAPTILQSNKSECKCRWQSSEPYEIVRYSMIRLRASSDQKLSSHW